MWKRSPQLRLFACCLVLTGLLVFTAGGCGPGGTPTATVSGKVRYKGSVVPGGTITFVTDKEVNKQTTFIAPIDAEGQYKFVGVPLDSTAKVGVDTLTAKSSVGFGPGNLPPEVLAKMKKENPKAFGATSPAAKYREIPAKYANPDTSGITVKITKDLQENQDIELP
jgi:hypothetical protein